MRRRLMEEVSYAIGHETGAIMWDLENFYDSINWEYMVKWAMETKFDPIIMLFGRPQYAHGPDADQGGPLCGGVHGRQEQCDSGVRAGG